MSIFKKETTNLRNAEGNIDGYLENLHDNGQLRWRGNIKNGMCEGLWEFFEINGKLFMKGNYINGQEVGWWEIYNSDAEVGWWEIYNSNADLIKEPFYVNI